MTNTNPLTCFKAYDVRGQLGSQLTPDVAYRIGRAYAEHFSPESVVVGGDARLTSEALKFSLAAGLIDGNTNVIDIGMCGTEEVYFATMHLPVNGGIEVTASHNPIDYNGMKLVREKGIPVSGDTGLNTIKAIAENYDSEWIDAQLAYWLLGQYAEDNFISGKDVINEEKLHTSGKYIRDSSRSAYVDHLMTYITPSNLSHLKIVVNAGNGAAGPALDAVESKFNELGVPITFIKVHHAPDGNFPNGIPNPMLEEGRKATEDAVIEHGADFGVAWDGDFDRCFLFDHKGNFIEGYYIVGLLADAFLSKNPSDKIVFDPRLYWNTQGIITRHNGKGVMCKTGHAFIKERMRKENAVYGGEMSAHHYFKAFSYCDSGMIPWLLIADLMRQKQTTLADMIEARISAFPTSGEINIKHKAPDEAMERIKQHFEKSATSADFTDGIGFNFDSWRFNLRQSNTEPLLRLNVETRQDTELLKTQTQMLLQFIGTE
ncbi:phosphomannomutase CpsG [Alteromonas sp. KUL49]|uniref:phosphomannomutase CpsG n=1 Tax=Alteromonas sp. KUL49 TaxID=2480798 RepID=UPI00102F0D99|nr:phosphomannomutase CpsG [Alteromonas sp. KUL49]TAP42342.1 phosphomannomutase CpsG [Alteromonas sp. KUL49]GEA09954.1 phosphomannomutase [Alteromonas sp. KUL49]